MSTTNEIVQLIRQGVGFVAYEFSAADSTPESLRTLKGEKGKETPLYCRLKGKQGIYFILQNESFDSIVYVGRTDDGEKRRRWPTGFGGISNRILRCVKGYKRRTLN